MSNNNSVSLLFGVGNIELKVSGRVVYYVGICGNYSVYTENQDIVHDDAIVRALTIDKIKKTSAKYLKKCLKKYSINPSNSTEHKNTVQNILNNKLKNKVIKNVIIQSIEIEKIYFRHVNVELHYPASNTNHLYTNK